MLSGEEGSLCILPTRLNGHSREANGVRLRKPASRDRRWGMDTAYRNCTKMLRRKADSLDFFELGSVAAALTILSCFSNAVSHFLVHSMLAAFVPFIFTECAPVFSLAAQLLPHPAPCVHLP